MLYVTDTHSLVWFLTDDLKIGTNALEIFQKADRGECIIIIPTIVLAEILYIIEKKDSSIKFENILEILKNSINYVTYNLDLEVLLKAQELTKILEIHDKIITATAKLFNAKVLTKDSTIKKSNYVDIIW